jgi:predicted metal-dependent phosphoesterase TrpH
LKGHHREGKRWLKAEMHAHCCLDPQDYGICEFTPEQLILEAARQGFEVLSITCHDANVWTEGLSRYAESLGIILIPGMEVTTERTRHVLIYNTDLGPEKFNTLTRIRSNSGEDTLIVAPHPFYPGRSCLGGYLRKNLDVFDAIEYSGFRAPGIDFNRRGQRLTAESGKPLVGFGDIHQLWQLGRTCTWIYAEPEIYSVLGAIRQGLVRIETSPLSWLEVAAWWATTMWRKAFPANPPPRSLASDQVEDGRRLGTANEGMEPQRIHIGQQG